ncbi:MAG: single-stranded DNA-binding protein [Candidatus Saccharibacteria bacterium]|nr:single-stranded DNA-binding protein [Candidatus Saccharibacteria bacterium]
MVKGFSKAIILGNLTRDPEMRTTPSGTNVCSFSVAVNRSFRGANGQTTEQVSFIDCSAWGKTAEVICQYLHKGSGILVSGRLDQHSWEDKATGQKRSHVEITVEDFNFVGNTPGQGGGYNNGGGYEPSSQPSQDNVPATKPAPMGEVVPDDIPDGQIDLSDMPF